MENLLFTRPWTLPARRCGTFCSLVTATLAMSFVLILVVRGTTITEAIIVTLLLLAATVGLRPLPAAVAALLPGQERLA